MPTRSLVTRYEDDLALIQSVWHKVAVLVGVTIVVAYPFAASAANADAMNQLAPNTRPTRMPSASATS